MGVYILRRLLFIPLVLFFIMLVNFAFTQVVPGGPVEKIIAQISGEDKSSLSRISGEGSSDTSSGREKQNQSQENTSASKEKNSKQVIFFHFFSVILFL